MERNGIAGAGRNEIVCLIRSKRRVPVLPGEGELMHALGWDGGCV